MQCACVRLSSAACPLLQYFSTYPMKSRIFFKKNYWTQNARVFWFSLQLLSETFLILRRTERDTIKSVYRSSCKVPLLLSYFNETWIFSTYFQKIPKYENLSSLRRVVPCGGQSDKTKLIVAFNNSANAPNTDKVVIWYMTPCLLVICYRV